MEYVLKENVIVKKAFMVKIAANQICAKIIVLLEGIVWTEFVIVFQVGVVSHVKNEFVKICAIVMESV
jgi:hypothetical protein